MTPLSKTFIITINILLYTISEQTDVLLEDLLSVPIRPNQIRLSFIPDGMVVSWQTFGRVPYGSNPNLQPTVLYGLSPESLNETSTDGDWSVYNTQNSSCISYFYNVKLHNLTSSTTHYYQIQKSTYADASDIYSFQSAPEVGNQNRPINVTILGDLGVEFLLSNGDARRTMNALQQMIPSTDFFIHSGDFAYADDTPDYESAFNSWQNDMTNVTSVRAYMTCVGNHEASCRQFGEGFCPNELRNYSAYFHRFRMPGPESDGFSNMWWSHDYGMVHVIAIDTETDFTNAPSNSTNEYPTDGNFLNNNAQLMWLRNDLDRANANRNQVPWILVTGHRPWYGTTSLQNLATKSNINCPQCKEAFEPLLIDYNVDFYIAGHVHWYERFCPQGVDCVNNTSVYRNPQGPIYITNGGAGGPEGIYTPVYNTTPADSVKLIAKAGFAQIVFQNRNEAIWNYYLSTDPSAPEDSVYIFKMH